MQKPERHIWEEGSTHRAVAGKEYDEVWDYVASLEAEMAGMKLMEMEGQSFAQDIVKGNERLEAQVAGLREALKKANSLVGYYMLETGHTTQDVWDELSRDNIPHLEHGEWVNDK